MNNKRKPNMNINSHSLHFSQAQTTQVAEVVSLLEPLSLPTPLLLSEGWFHKGCAPREDVHGILPTPCLDANCSCAGSLSCYVHTCGFLPCPKDSFTLVTPTCGSHRLPIPSLVLVPEPALPPPSDVYVVCGMCVLVYLLVCVYVCVVCVYGD